MNIFTLHLFFHLMFKTRIFCIVNDCTHYSSLLVMLHYSDDFCLKIKCMFIHGMENIAEGCLQLYSRTFHIHFTWSYDFHVIM